MPNYSKRWQRLSAKAKAYYRSHPELEVQCGLCFHLIDMWLPHTDRYAFTLDHIIPKALGGQDSMANARPAHRGCNSRRARLLEQANAQPTMELLIKSTKEW